MNDRPRRYLAGLSGLLVLGVLTPAPAGATEPADADSSSDRAGLRVISVGADGEVGNQSSSSPAVSADGSVIAFTSWATNLVDDVEVEHYQSYVYDSTTETMDLISRTPDGEGGNGSSYMDDISADGRYVVFQSDARDLVDGVGIWGETYWYDRVTGELDLVSATYNGEPSDGGSGYASVSADGRYVVFESRAQNLVDHPTAMIEIYVRDMQTGETKVVSRGLDGELADDFSSDSDISDDGRYVVFGSGASNLAPDDPDGDFDVFRHDLATGENEVVTLDWRGRQTFAAGNMPTTSSDGRFVTWVSDSDAFVRHDDNELQDVFVRDLKRGKTRILSATPNGRAGDGDSSQATISADGKRVTFVTSAHDLVDERFGPRAFVMHNLAKHTTELVQRISGQIDNQANVRPTNGRGIVFETKAKLVQQDTNGASDIYLRRL